MTWPGPEADRAGVFECMGCGKAVVGTPRELHEHGQWDVPPYFSHVLCDTCPITRLWDR